MKTITTNIYTFNELNKEAQSKAIENWRNNEEDYYPLWSDAEKTMKAFAREVGIDIVDYSIDYDSTSRSYIKYDFCSDLELLNGKILAKELRVLMSDYITDPFKLTGYFLDQEIMRPIQDYCTGIADINTHASDVIDMCLDAFIKAVIDDAESLNTDEAIKETLEVNEYEFYENGNIYY